MKQISREQRKKNVDEKRYACHLCNRFLISKFHLEKHCNSSVHNNNCIIPYWLMK